MSMTMGPVLVRRSRSTFASRIPLVTTTQRMIWTKRAMMAKISMPMKMMRSQVQSMDQQY